MPIKEIRDQLVDKWWEAHCDSCGWSALFQQRGTAESSLRDHKVVRHGAKPPKGPEWDKRRVALVKMLRTAYDWAGRANWRGVDGPPAWADEARELLEKEEKADVLADRGGGR